MKKFFFQIPVCEMRERIFELASQYDHFAVLDSCSQVSFENIPVNYKIVAGLGTKKFISAEKNALKELDQFLNDPSNTSFWKFGMLSYDLKNEIEHLDSSNIDIIGFPLLHFFIPEVVISLKDECIEIDCYSENQSAEKIYQQLIATHNEIASENDSETIEPVLPPVEDYCKIVDKIKYHLHRGDIYEMNYCMQLLQKCSINPLSVYKRLTEYSPSPFSTLARINEHYLMCASPERFIAKEGARIYSQPMKGTRKRSGQKDEDDFLKEELRQSEKERAENVMIVDLVRNDLSRIAKKSSVKVDELFGVYTFPRVHQMVSTISAQLRDDVSFVDIIRAMFPMGSMTGAPKMKAMQLIEEFENFKRGVFSGSVGYIDPDENFDFNVVIRSIVYNARTNQLSIPVGSAITAKSHAMQEYDECILKAQGMLNALGIKRNFNDVRE